MEGLHIGLVKEVVQEVEQVAQRSNELASEPAVFLPHAGNDD